MDDENIKVENTISVKFSITEDGGEFEITVTSNEELRRVKRVLFEVLERIEYYKCKCKRERFEVEVI